MKVPNIRLKKDNIINDENTRENEHQDVDNSQNNDMPKGNQFSKVQNSNNQNDNKHDINEFVSKEGYSKLLQQRIIKMEMTLIIRLL